MTGHIRRARQAAVAAVGVAVAVALAGCGRQHTAGRGMSSNDPNRAPSGLRWEVYQGISVPIGDDGPAQEDGGAATGYRDTPQGAVLAAINDSVRMSTATNDAWPSIAAGELAAGPGKDAYILARVRISITGPANPATAPSIVGYRITSYTPDHADITVISRYPDKSLSATATRVVWTGGDWRLALPDPAGKTRTITAINTVPANTIRLESAS